MSEATAHDNDVDAHVRNDGDDGGDVTAVVVDDAAQPPPPPPQRHDDTPVVTADDEAATAAAATHAETDAVADDAAALVDNNDNNDNEDEVTLKDLFGAFFRLDVVASAPDEPLLADTRGILRAMFGAHVGEADVHVLPRETLRGGAAASVVEAELRRELDRNHQVRLRDHVESLFGVNGTDALASEAAVERYTLLHADALASPPPASLLQPPQQVKERQQPQTHDDGAATCDELWLVDMPKIAPNRLVLHADPQPFAPSRSAAPLTSNARMLYTPANVLRWAYHAGQDLYLSNARVVRWSDGSVTLHVGSDVHDLAASRDRATLHLLGSDVQLRHAGSGAALPAVVATVTPQRHLVVESHAATSIEQAIVREGQQRESAASRMKLAYATVSMPDIDWSRPQKSRNLYEEYVAHEYERRSKELQRRAREGRPMTLAEQIALEQEMLQHLRNTSAETLRDERQQQVLLQQQRRHAGGDTAAAAVANGGGRVAQPRSRLDRDLGLTAGGHTTLYDLTAANDDDDDNDNDKHEDEVTRSQRHALKRSRRSDDDDDSSSSSSSSASRDNDDDDDDDDDFATMLRAMQRKHARDDDDDAAERRRTVARYEDAQRQRFAPLTDALRALASRLPVDSDAHGSVQSTLTFLRGGAFATGMVTREVPLLLREVTTELPGTDTSDVAAALQRIVATADDTAAALDTNTMTTTTTTTTREADA